jgi:hypothetical protein
LTAFFCEQVLAGSGDADHHDQPHHQGAGAAHPTELPSTTLAALRILTMAQAMAAVRVVPSRPTFSDADTAASRCGATRKVRQPALYPYLST